MLREDSVIGSEHEDHENDLIEYQSGRDISRTSFREAGASLTHLPTHPPNH